MHGEYLWWVSWILPYMRTSYYVHAWNLSPNHSEGSSQVLIWSRLLQGEARTTISFDSCDVYTTYMWLLTWFMCCCKHQSIWQSMIQRIACTSLGRDRRDLCSFCTDLAGILQRWRSSGPGRVSPLRCLQQWIGLNSHSPLQHWLCRTAQVKMLCTLRRPAIPISKSFICLIRANVPTDQGIDANLHFYIYPM